MHHFQFLKSNIRFGISNSRNLSITNSIQILIFLTCQARHIRSAILNFENPNSDLDLATPTAFTLKILRVSEVFFLKNIFDTICSFSPDSEGVKGAYYLVGGKNKSFSVL